MVEENQELGLTLPPPAISAEEIERLVGILREAGDWMTAKEIAEKIGNGQTDRRARRVASAARPVVVSFPGSKGYKLWQLCTVAEIDHCIAALESQGSDMIKGAVLYRQAYYRRFRGAPGGSQS